MFEIGRKKCDGELSDVGDDEADTVVAPTDNGVGVAVLDHIVTFFQERRHRTGRFHHRQRLQQTKKRLDLCMHLFLFSIFYLRKNIPMLMTYLF